MKVYLELVGLMAGRQNTVDFKSFKILLVITLFQNLHIVTIYNATKST